MENEFKVLADKPFNVEDLTPIADIYMTLADSAVRMAHKHQLSADGYDITNGPLTIICTVQRDKENASVDLGWEWRSFEYKEEMK